MKDLEFLPEYHIRARQNQRLRLTRMWLLSVLTLTMVCWAVFSQARVASVKAHLVAANDKMTVINYERQKKVLEQLRQQEMAYQAQQTLVEQLGADQRGSRTGLLRAMCGLLPDQVVLTRIEVDRHERPTRGGVRPPVATSRRRGVKPKEPPKQMVDRVRIEGFAKDDLSLARFLQSMNDSRIFEQGELGFSKDASFNDCAVRVFTATFFTAVQESVNAGPKDD